MHFLNQLTVLALAATPLVSSVALDLEKRASPLSVTLSKVSNTVVKAIVKNTADKDLTVLKSGTFLDSAPVEKATVLKNGAAQPFKGLRFRIKTTNLTSDAFTTIPAGQTAESTFDIASVHSLSSGGVYNVLSAGAFAIASGSDLSGEKVPFESNTLALDIDGAKAAKVAPAVKELDQRTVLRSCAGSQNTALRTALGRTVTLSNNAAAAALTNNAKMNEYFHSTTTATKNTVNARFKAVAAQAGSTTSGATSYYCTDPYGYCDPNVLAYTLPSQNVIANCNIYYNLPGLTSTCHAQDQATTSLHEFTHAPGTYSPGTQDNAYGYSASVALSTSRAILNADTYALFANAIYVGC